MIVVCRWYIVYCAVGVVGLCVLIIAICFALAHPFFARYSPEADIFCKFVVWKDKRL